MMTSNKPEGRCSSLAAQFVLGALVLALGACGGGESVELSQTEPGGGSSDPSGGGSGGGGAPGGGGSPGGGTPTPGQVTLSWLPPTARVDGSSFTDLAGYRIYYGVDAAALSSVVNVDNGGVSSYVVDGLNSGQTYYFAIAAADSTGLESQLSNTVSAIPQ